MQYITSKRPSTPSQRGYMLMHMFQCVRNAKIQDYW